MHHRAARQPRLRESCHGTDLLRTSARRKSPGVAFAVASHFRGHRNRSQGRSPGRSLVYFPPSGTMAVVHLAPHGTLSPRRADFVACVTARITTGRRWQAGGSGGPCVPST